MLSRNLFELAATGKHILDFSPTGLVLYACQSWAVRNKVLQIANPQTWDLINFFRICGTFKICDLRNQSFLRFVYLYFAVLRFADFRKSLLAHL
jgi:hypothetical protein